MALATTDHYTIISADTHAGGEPRRRTASTSTRSTVDDFDAWRSKYKNPFKDLRDTDLRVRNWDNERRDWPTRTPTASSARSIFPNTVPPFFPSFVLFAPPPKPEDYEHRLAGIRAHNRWLVDFVRRVPRAARRHRADLPQRRRRRDRGRRSGSRSTACAAACSCPTSPPDVQVGEAALRPGLRPAVGGAAKTSRSRSTRTAAPARPTTAGTPSVPMIMITEVGFYSQRPFVHLLLGGRVRALPAAEVRDDRDGRGVDARRCSKQLDGDHRERPDRARSASSSTPRSTCSPRSATEYFQQNCWVGASQPGPADADGPRGHGRRPLHVGQRLPARRGHLPVHHASTCARCSTTPIPPSSSGSSPATRRSSTTSTSTRSAPIAERVRPDGRRDRAAPAANCRRTRTARSSRVRVS